MFEPKLKIDRSLYDRLTKAAEVAGYASTEEFALHILKTAAEDITTDTNEEEIRERLKGLGYLE